jgi:transcriptional regulator with XRE-family HTH domain
MDRQLIAKTLESRGLKKTDFAKALGIPNSAVTALLKGDRLLKAEEVVKAKRFLGLDTVPLKGFVGAGANTVFFELPDSAVDRVPAPDDATDKTVAVEIRGDSLGAPFDRWLVYYDDVHRPVTRMLFNKLCVVGLSDGRILIKKLVPAKQKGLFHLIPTQGETIMDVPVEWAAMVKGMRPRP